MGFFDTKRASIGPLTKFALSAREETVRKKAAVHFGYDRESGFLSLAAGVLDWILTYPSRKHDVCIDIINQHLAFYPNYEQMGRNLDAVKRLQVMMTKPSFLVDLAYTFCRMAAKERSRDPACYPLDMNTHLLMSATPLNRIPPLNNILVAALANRLNLPVTVYQIESNKKIPLSLDYGPRTQLGSTVVNRIELELKGKIYHPKLNQAEIFLPIVRDRIAMQNPITDALEVSSPELVAEEALEADKALLESFNDNLKVLNDWVSKQSISRSQLVDLYIKGINLPEKTNSARPSGLEYGSQAFFERALENVQCFNGGKVTFSLGSDTDSDDKVMTQLLHGIARTVTMGDLNQDDIYVQEHSSALAMP